MSKWKYFFRFRFMRQIYYRKVIKSIRIKFCREKIFQMDLSYLTGLLTSHNSAPDNRIKKFFTKTTGCRKKLNSCRKVSVNRQSFSSKFELGPTYFQQASKSCSQSFSNRNGNKKFKSILKS